MRFLKRLILDWLHEPENNCGPINMNAEVQIIEHAELDHDSVWTFKVFPANGGKIVEIRKYDDKKGRSYNERYLITDDKDFNISLGRIISVEFLKN